ncbi:MAG: hypothetical protein ABEJ31_00020 [Haloarculaceae archaeon]
MQRDRTRRTGWALLADGDSLPAIIDALLRLEADATLTRSELAAETDVSLKTLHVMDDLDLAVDLGLLDRRDPDGGEVRYTVNGDSEVLALARELGAAVADAYDAADG